MKFLLALVVLIVVIAALVAVPLASNMEAQTERARAARIVEETRLEQARAETVTARADAFGMKTMAMLPWGLLILGGVFVGTLIVVLVFRPQQRNVDTLSPFPPQIGQRPIYFVQGPNESPEAFMMRVYMQTRQIEAPERLAR